MCCPRALGTRLSSALSRYQGLFYPIVKFLANFGARVPSNCTSVHSAPHRTGPHQEPMSATDLASPPDRSPGSTAEVMRAAFRELHGRRLHGFALLLTLGDRPEAARLASEALGGRGRARRRAAPPRARCGVAAEPGGRAGSSRRRPNASMPGRCSPSGVDDAAGRRVRALGRLERAALIASAIERLDRRDVASIVGRDGSSLDRFLRARAGAAHASLADDRDASHPRVRSRRTRTSARRAMA